MSLQSFRESSELLAKLTNTELELFESLSREIEARDNEILFEEGDHADTFYVVIEGRVALEITSPGKGPMIIQTLGPGDLVGLSWLLPPHRWNWRARVMGDSRLIAFDAVEVRRQCEENRDLALEVYQVVADEVASRLHSTRIRLLDLYSRP
jgi:CRP/FNR family transcriptional regulator, cyclic AMP receptor protein